MSNSTTSVDAAIIDSGSAGNFISGRLCERLNLQKINTSKPYSIHAVTGEIINKGNIVGIHVLPDIQRSPVSHCIILPPVEPTPEPVREKTSIHIPEQIVIHLSGVSEHTCCGSLILCFLTSSHS
ncbi:hypothetical protein R3I94_022620 [Phoxinus phoxinus]